MAPLCSPLSEVLNCHKRIPPSAHVHNKQLLREGLTHSGKTRKASEPGASCPTQRAGRNERQQSLSTASCNYELNHLSVQHVQMIITVYARGRPRGNLCYKYNPIGGLRSIHFLGPCFGHGRLRHPQSPRPYTFRHKVPPFTVDILLVCLLSPPLIELRAKRAFILHLRGDLSLSASRTHLFPTSQDNASEQRRSKRWRTVNAPTSSENKMGAELLPVHHVFSGRVSAFPILFSS